MSSQPLQSAKRCLTIACILLLFETMLGFIYVLGIGFGSAHDIVMDLCLTMAFPVYLIGGVSLRWASVSLWAFFAIQWGIICLVDKPLRFVNPFGWAHGNLSFAGAVLVSLSIWMLSRVEGSNVPNTLLDIMDAK